MTIGYWSKSRQVVVRAAMLAVLFGALVNCARAQTGTTSGELWVEPPTLVSLGFEWSITGDDNHNAKVEVSYRKKGEQQWHSALPLLRLDHEMSGQGITALDRPTTYVTSTTGANVNPGIGNPQPIQAFSYVAPNMFSGSILNLEPDTDYECRFKLTDPDGVAGEKVKTVTVHTRPEPMPAAGGHVYHVYPIGYKGPKQEPAFTGLIAAYYMSCHTSDFQNAFPPRVKPGDTILVHAGLYIGDMLKYTNAGDTPGTGTNVGGLCTLFDGTYYLTANGTPDKPIVIKSAGDGEVIFDGAQAQNLFNLMAANYNYFEGITVRNTNVAFMLGIRGIAGSSGFTLKHSRIYDVGRVVEDDWSGSKNFYIADNVLIGRHEPSQMLGWTPVWTRYPHFPEILGGNQGSEYAVKVYGQGHVVAYNYVANWHDGIDVATYGNPDGTPRDGNIGEVRDHVPLSIDFYNNDIYNMGDNCIETDGGARNIRVFQNRCFNSAGGALSAEPTVGGPIYVYRNLVYNTARGSSLKYVYTPMGLLTYQNTFIGDARSGATSNEYFLNNLILGEDTPTPVFTVSTFTNYSTSDFNAFRPNKGANHSFEWNSPPFDVSKDYKTPLTARPFKLLADDTKATGQEKHSILVDYDVFMNVTMPDQADLQRLYKPEEYDFRLKPGSAPIDAGTIIPTITDGFIGRAPDIGAYETGGPLPHYGPRTMPPGSHPFGVELRSWSGPPTNQ
jgi:hypothetical protein